MNMDQAIQFNKYLPVAILYFFFNGFLLPHGLLYTTLLSPIFLIWLSKKPIIKYFWLFFVLIAPFVAAHFLHGVSGANYLKSFLLFLSVYVFSMAAYEFLSVCGSIRIIYKDILLINALFVILAIIALKIPSMVNRFWFTNAITTGIVSVKRLQMLTYEPSYYSFLLAPIALYYILKQVILQLPNPKTYLILVSVPLVLSLSFGVILGLSLSLILTFLWGFRILFPGNKLLFYLLIASILMLVLLVLVWEFFPNNLVFVRINNVFSGRDTSFKGRTFDSFYLAWEIARTRSIWFGVGLGQVKEIGLHYFIQFYNNTSFTIDQIGIPNAVADTLATFGIFGVAIRMFLEIYFFFKTRVYKNYYRLCLFFFVFIYQFTGSYIMNVAEYLVWVMAFHQGIFTEFDRSYFRSRLTGRHSIQIPITESHNLSE
ncbi:MAG: hypothetical protein C5B59_00050 [Bacteroidetes bacterium]|nr:MAG: hypothetical protein C5B59_00050 [Bacteroidota bacterium]